MVLADERAMADARAQQSAADVPQAHEGAHYPNPSSKPLRGPVAVTERTPIQRLVWRVFFVVILGVVALGVVLGLIFRPA